MASTEITDTIIEFAIDVAILTILTITIKILLTAETNKILHY